MQQLPDFNTVSFTAIERNGEPWITSIDLARALGYSRPNNITKIYERNAGEFRADMTAIALRGDPERQFDVPGQPKRETDVRIFSLRGAHLVAMFARTPVAAAFRKWVLDVLDDRARTGGYDPETSRVTTARLMLRLEDWLATRETCTIPDAASAIGIYRDGEGMAAVAAMLRTLGWKKAWVRDRPVRRLPAPGEVA